MSAARFREAAKVLRERADMATEGHIWHAALDGTVEVCCECGTARKNAPDDERWHASILIAYGEIDWLRERADRVCGAINVDDLMAERDALAARLAAVEAALDHAEQLPDAGGLYHDVPYREGVEHTVTRLRAALATGTTTNQQEADQ